MRLLNTKMRHVLRESLQTFVVTVVFLIFAISLTFLKDWCISTKRPEWLVTGIEFLSIVMFVTDVLVIFAICARVFMTAVREIADELGKAR
jgi:hypothetical protein